MQEWKKVQERNREYVCYTRAKKTLAFMSEDGFKFFLNGASDGNSSKLKDKEIDLTMLTHRIVPSVKATKNNYKEILKNATKVSVGKINSVKSDSLVKSEELSLSSIGRRKKKIKL